MSDESIESAGKRSISRRTALKAGVAGGVGLAAWSGATITSLGGTPAYALSSTQIINLDITAGCRNIDNSSTALWRYHPVSPSLPSGFTITTISNGTDCGVTNAVLTWDSSHPNLTCTLTISFFVDESTHCTSGSYFNHCVLSSAGTATGGSLTFPLDCYDTPPTGPSDKWTLTGHCATNGSGISC